MVCAPKAIRFLQLQSTTEVTVIWIISITEKHTTTTLELKQILPCTHFTITAISVSLYIISLQLGYRKINSVRQQKEDKNIIVGICYGQKMYQNHISKKKRWDKRVRKFHIHRISSASFHKGNMGHRTAWDLQGQDNLFSHHVKCPVITGKYVI